MALKKVLKELSSLIQAQKKKAVGSIFSSKGKGGLKRSIKERVTGTEKKGYQIVSTMLEYGKFQDSGVSGTKKKVRANTNSLFKPGKFSGRKTMIGGNLPFAARVSIYQKGLKPKPFVKPSVLSIMNSVGYDMIAEASAEDVALAFKSNFKKVKA
tara:strand:- start:173 stop:637 length:465 start_codon:yes stop_codon:yes gene_type:complete